MASFTLLPNEIVIQILDLCRPDGFKPLALRCQHNYLLAQIFLEEHQHCKWQSKLHYGIRALTYTTIRCLKAYSPRVPLLQLRYIKIAYIGLVPSSSSRMRRTLFSMLDQVNKAPTGLRQAVEDTAQPLRNTLAFQPPEPRRDFQDMMKHLVGQEQHQLDGLDCSMFLELLLLSLTINVTTMHIDERYLLRNYEHLDKIISASTINPGFLRMLEQVHIADDQDNTGSAFIRAVQPLLKLPRLKSIMIQGRNQIEWIWSGSNCSRKNPSVRELLRVQARIAWS